MKKSIERALDNIVNHGDTDIFPYPIENRILFDEKKGIIKHLLEADKDFEKFITTFPPANYGTLAPVGYTGFRWATQIDPLWNVYFLALVIEIGEKIENTRLPTSTETIFSYRFEKGNKANLFDKEIGWRKFTERAIELAGDFNFVVACDISEFYPRVNHHRLDNALRQIEDVDRTRKKLMNFLSNFSETYSFGLPVGGPASRLLSELTLNQIDRLLYQKRVTFCRFADDFYLFANDQSDAFKQLVYLSEILQRNQGLQLQKSKTRLMSNSEFLNTNPLSMEIEETLGADQFAEPRKQLFSLSLHFDPYSPTADSDYESLKKELKKFPILDLIKSELTKTRVNISIARKLIKTLRFISKAEINDAAITLVENHELLYPVYFNVLSALRSEFDNLSSKTQIQTSTFVTKLIEDQSSTMSVDLNLQYAVRFVACLRSEEALATLAKVYDQTNSEMIRRDIVLIMAKWGNWIWLSDRRAYFRTMRPAERRAFIIASYYLKDEGTHWRKHTKDEFSPMEIIVRDWAADKVNSPDWEIPL